MKKRSLDGGPGHPLYDGGPIRWYIHNGELSYRRPSNDSEEAIK